MNFNSCEDTAVVMTGVSFLVFIFVLRMFFVPLHAQYNILLM